MALIVIFWLVLAHRQACPRRLVSVWTISAGSASCAWVSWKAGARITPARALKRRPAGSRSTCTGPSSCWTRSCTPCPSQTPRRWTETCHRPSTHRGQRSTPHGCICIDLIERFISFFPFFFSFSFPLFGPSNAVQKVFQLPNLSSKKVCMKKTWAPQRCMLGLGSVFKSRFNEFVSRHSPASQNGWNGSNESHRLNVWRIMQKFLSHAVRIACTWNISLL